MLASCAAERDHQTGKFACHKGLHMRFHHAIYMIQILKYFPIILKDVYDWLISSGPVEWFFCAALKSLKGN